MSLLAPSMLRRKQAQRDNASLVIDGIWTTEPLIEEPQAWPVSSFGVQEPIDFEQVEDYIYDLAATPGLFIEKVSLAYTSGSVSFVFGTYSVVEEEDLIDEPLPRLALKRQYARVTLKVRGKGSPRSGFESEISLYDD